MKWCRLNGFHWNELTCEAAAVYPNLLKWCKGCPWKKDNIGRCKWLTHTCASVARENNLDLLIWGRKNGCEWDESVTRTLAMTGNVSLLKWCLGVGRRQQDSRIGICPWDQLTVLYSCMYGHYNVLKWCLIDCEQDNIKKCEYNKKSCLDVVITHIDDIELRNKILHILN